MSQLPPALRTKRTAIPWQIPACAMALVAMVGLMIYMKQLINQPRDQGPFLKRPEELPIPLVFAPSRAAGVTGRDARSIRPREQTYHSQLDCVVPV